MGVKTMSRPSKYKVTIRGSVIVSVGPKTLLDDLEVKSQQLKLDIIEEIRLEDDKGNVFGRRTPKVR